MGHLNPLACVGFAGNKGAKRAKAATTESAKTTKPDPAPPVAANDASAGRQAAATAAGTKRRGAAGKSGGVNARPSTRGHEGEATVCRGGFMPYRPLYSYDIDPLANSMYFYGSVGGIMC